MYSGDKETAQDDTNIGKSYPYINGQLENRPHMYWKEIADLPIKYGILQGLANLNCLNTSHRENRIKTQNT